MTAATFWETIFERIALPFEYEDVEDIIFLGELPFVKLNNGQTYAIHIKPLTNKSIVSVDQEV